MQNPHVKYLKTKNGFHLFYYEHGSILCRHFAEEIWSKAEKITESASPIFSLCQYREKAHLLYSNADGQLFIASSNDLNQWEHSPITADIKNSGNTKFFLLPSEDAFHLIYHQPTESTGIDALVYTVFRNGKWEKPYQIDRFLPMQKTPFLARRLQKNHIILYYRTGRNVLSAREMLLEPYTMGSLTPLFQTPSPISDLSIVNDNEKIHLLYIVRGMFRTQVVYQYKHTSAISTPRIIWEDNGCDSCIVSLENNKVILLWTVNGQPMRCVSENGGAAFGAAERYTDAFPTKPIKAELIGAETLFYNSTECYGDRQSFLPAVCPLLQPSQPPRPIPQPDLSKAYTTFQEHHRKKIEELTILLSQRSDEIAAVNARWKTYTEKLEQELEKLKAENTQLKRNSLKTEKSTD